MIALILSFLALFHAAEACRCYTKSPEPVDDLILSPLPHTQIKASDLPQSWDWRNINGVNYCSKVLTQQNPNVCGSCWAEAATGALSDRYAIATANKLRVQLGLQNLLNFKQKITGGGCTGGDSKKAYQFIHKYGIADDTCAPFIGLDYIHGFEVADMVDVSDVKNHQCFLCSWNGVCSFAKPEYYDLYGADEYGHITGVDNIKAEIYARGPVACALNSEATEFNDYHGGIITCDDPADTACADEGTDHVVVIAGWGFDKSSNSSYWIGRNSYGTRWGEGAGGGWFRLKLGSDTLNMESGGCSWATPAAADVQRALKQFSDSL